MIEGGPRFELSRPERRPEPDPIEGGTLEYSPELGPGSPELLRDSWLRQLADFIVEANLETWAAGRGEVSPDKVERPGYKEHEYSRGEWRLRDSYTGDFRAPGMTTVYYRDVPVWTISYGGTGTVEGFYDRTKPTFTFLRRALQQVTPELPFRGPQEYTEDSKRYTFRILRGDITDCEWDEEIREEGLLLTFRQTGSAGIIIHRDQDRRPVYPWGPEFDEFRKWFLENNPKSGLGTRERGALKIATPKLAQKINDMLGAHLDDRMTWEDVLDDPRYSKLKAQLTSHQFAQFTRGFNILVRRGFRTIDGMRAVLADKEKYGRIPDLGENRGRFMSQALARRASEE